MLPRTVQRLSSVRRMASSSFTKKRGRIRAEKEGQEESTVVDNPCWGSPTCCSLSDLLKLISQKEAILHETNDYLVLNKPADLRMDGAYPATVHKLLSYWYPPPSLQGLAEAQLLKQVAHLHRHSDIVDNELRPCHQLDYATSGVLLVARNKPAADAAREAFEDRLAKKAYLAVLHGHVNISKEWPVISKARVDQCLQKQEESYRRNRHKRRKDTFVGYQPPHALFQQWHQQQRRGKTGSSHKLTADEWTTVWAELQLQENELEDLHEMNWKQVRAAGKKPAFERAAEVYNGLLREKIKGIDEEEPSLPTFFRVEGDDEDAFYVFAALAQVADNFAMRLHPSMKGQIEVISASSEKHRSHLLVGDTSQDLDYKPSLTKCTVQEKSRIEGQPVTKVWLEPRTGRRHQLRVHTALAGHAIVGDQTYQASDAADISERMCLHSHQLQIPLQGEVLEVTASDPFIEGGKGQGCIDVSLV